MQTNAWFVFCTEALWRRDDTDAGDGVELAIGTFAGGNGTDADLPLEADATVFFLQQLSFCFRHP